MACLAASFPGGENDLEGCLASYASRGLKLPEEGHVLGPWVEVTFEGSGSLITVGNDSSPNTSPANVAVIKSFEFGYSDGLSVRVVIHDEQGGSFVKFMDNMLKHYVCLKDGSPATVRMKFSFGWTKSSCNSSLPPASSRCFYALCDSVETNFTGGKFIFELTGKDLCYRMFEGGTEQIYGGEGQNAIPITQAIQEYMTNGCPPNVSSVRFCKMEGGTCQKVKFEKYDFEGPSGKWVANGQDKLRVCMRWLEGYRTENQKAFIPQYNSLKPGGELIFWEDSKPKDVQTDDYWEKNCIGTYIVNGGKSSPVIEFNPKVRWDFGRLVSSGGASSSETVKPLDPDGSKTPGRDVPGLDSKSNPCAGHNVQTTPTETHKDNEGKNATKEKQKGDEESMRAMKILHDHVEADLVIVGDPTLLPPSEAMWTSNVAIVLVNPYFITQGGLNCGEWLAEPICNEVLSSKAWICKSICHKIEAGNFTTTIGVYLTAPGIDTPPGTPLGAWSKGWVPKNNC
jgi:hypothetical protein